MKHVLLPAFVAALLCFAFVGLSETLTLDYEREFCPYSNEPGSGAEMEVLPVDYSEPCLIVMNYAAANNTLSVFSDNIVNATLRLESALAKYAPNVPDFYYTLAPSAFYVRFLEDDGLFVNLTVLELDRVPVGISAVDGSTVDWEETVDGVCIRNVTSGVYMVSFTEPSGVPLVPDDDSDWGDEWCPVVLAAIAAVFFTSITVAVWISRR